MVRLSSCSWGINCGLNINKPVEGNALACSASKFFLNLKSKLRKQNEISELLKEHKRSCPEKTTSTIFGLKQFFDGPKLQSKDKNLPCFAFENQLLFPYLFLNRVVSVCCHQSLKKKQRCQFWFCADAQNKTAWLCWEILQSWTKCLCKVFLLSCSFQKKNRQFQKRN